MKNLLIIFIVAITFIFAESDDKLKIGDKAPAVKAKTADGKTWNSEKYLNKKNIVYFFYPAAMTGGCTKQACSYRDTKDELKKFDAEIIGVSGDDESGLKIFQKAYNLNFTLLSDKSGEIAKKFGVPVSDGGKIERKVEGKNIELERGVTANRWTFVVNKSGEVIYIDKNVNPTKDSENVANVLKNQK